MFTLIYKIGVVVMSDFPFMEKAIEIALQNTHAPIRETSFVPPRNNSNIFIFKNHPFSELYLNFS